MTLQKQDNIETGIIITLFLGVVYLGYHYINNRRSDSSLNVTIPPKNNLGATLPPANNLYNNAGVWGESETLNNGFVNTKKN